MIWSGQNQFLKTAQLANILSVSPACYSSHWGEKHDPQLETSWAQFAFLVLVYEGPCKIAIIAKA